MRAVMKNMTLPNSGLIICDIVTLHICVFCARMHVYRISHMRIDLPNTRTGGVPYAWATHIAMRMGVLPIFRNGTGQFRKILYITILQSRRDKYLGHFQLLRICMVITLDHQHPAHQLLKNSIKDYGFGDPIARTQLYYYYSNNCKTSQASISAIYKN